MPLLTVITPALNAAATLRRTIASVVAQPFEDWELFIVDDGSTDSTGEVALTVAAGDPRIRVLRNERNLGAGASRDRAWRICNSPFVAFLDADDVALQGRFTLPLASLASDASLGVLGGAAHFVDRNGRFLRTVSLPCEHARLAARRWYACPFINSTVTLRRNFLEQMNGHDAAVRLGEDFDLWMRGFAHGGFRYGNLPDPLAVYTARRVQRWSMICNNAAVRMRAGRREGRLLRAGLAAVRVLLEGAVEQTGIFAWRDRLAGSRVRPRELEAWI